MKRFYKGSRTPEILHMHDQGLTEKEIAAHVSCSVSNVSQTLKRHVAPPLPVSGLSQEDWQWLRNTARRLNVKPALLARAVLTYAIAQAREMDILEETA